MVDELILRHRHASLSLPRRGLVAGLLAFALMLAVALLSLCMGHEWLSPGQVLAALAGRGEEEILFTVQTLRLPRVLMGIMVGAMLAVSGLVLQSLIRNPLASPDVTGVTGGASAAAVTFLMFFHGTLSIAFLPWFAIAGALVASLGLYLLAWNNGVSPMRLVLVGMGISAAMGAVTTFAIAASPLASTIGAYIWLTGSIYGAQWADVQALTPWCLLGLPMALGLIRHANAQELGDAVATGLGVRMHRTRLLLLLTSVLFAAPAVAYAGAVGFIGLIAPHIARRLAPRRFGALLPVSAATGAVILLLADLCGRTLFQPLDVPAGVFVSLVGAPFFLFLLYREAP